jgi:hypothetical protein
VYAKELEAALTAALSGIADATPTGTDPPGFHAPGRPEQPTPEWKSFLRIFTDYQNRSGLVVIRFS